MTLSRVEEFPSTSVMTRAAVERFCPLEQGRNFKIDVERNLDLGNFDKALSIAKSALHCAEINLKRPSCHIEEGVLKIFRDEFVRYINCIIPSRKRDLLRQKEREKLLAQQEWELERARISAHMESLYYIVDKDDYSSMHPAVTSPLSAMHPLKTHISPASGDELSPFALPKAPPNEMEASVYAPGNMFLRSPPLDANRLPADPLQFSSVESPHCSFYDTFSLHPSSINSIHPVQAPSKLSPIKLALHNNQIHYTNLNFQKSS